MGFADLVNKHWDDGVRPVMEGVRGVFSKAKEREDLEEQKTQQNDISLEK